MGTSHHLSAETLLDYASGSLSVAMETVVACHLTVCAHCRAQAAIADAVGAAEMNAADAQPMNATADSVLARSGEPRAPRTQGTGGSGDPFPGAHDGRVPRPLQRLLPGSLDDVPWRRVAPGIKQYNLSDEPRHQGAFKLLHLAPGVVLSGHTHNERELTYLVKGSYLDEIGRFRAGDIADLGGDVVHQPVVDTDEPCIALIATDSPVHYTGVFARLIQPFVGI